MSFVDTLPDDYQFTEQDQDRYWEMFDKCCGPNGPSPEATKEELDYFNVAEEAHRVSTILKRMPTMGELRQHWQREQEEQERRNANLLQEKAARDARTKAV